MIDYVIKNIPNPLGDIKAEMFKDQPLWKYVIKAVQDIEVINILSMYPINDEVGLSDAPFIHVCNWKWNPTPLAEQIQYRRRETGDKLSTKTIADSRIGILECDIYFGARDKNKRIIQSVLHNQIYVPIEDEKGRYLLENVMYSEYQLVDKLLYPLGGSTNVFKSLLPVIVKYEEATETSISGYIVTSRMGLVKIFSTMEPILSCFMHVPSPLSYLGVFPILQFCDRVLDDGDQYEYFKPIDSEDSKIYVKAYKKGLEKFDYVKYILIMACNLLRKYNPPSIDEVRDPKWWVYQMSYYDTLVEHRGACHETHVARMLDTISAQVLPIPEIDKRNMIAFLRYILMTEFDDVDIYSYDNKRLRLNEIISTIVTKRISDKLKTMFRYGTLLKMKDAEQVLKINPQIISKEFHALGTHHVVDFANDLDYYQGLRFTKNGPNSLGRLDKHKIGFGQRQLHPSMIGRVDLLECPKDVGQSGMISPWADMTAVQESYVNKYPNIKYELYKFIEKEFPCDRIRFGAKNLEEYNKMLDHLVLTTYVTLDYKVKPGGGDK